MSERQYKHYIEHELERLNNIIDFKIITGQSYKEEARKHKKLLRQLSLSEKKEFIVKLFTNFSRYVRNV